MKVKLRMCVAVLMTWLVVSPGFAVVRQAGVQQRTSSAGGQQAKQTAEPATEAVEYSNTKYGFRFSLPSGWKGYTIVTDQWEASDAQKGTVERGPIVHIRHPDWTKENPRQDIPIMVFTLTQWESVEHGDFFISGVAIVPGELGRNRKYAFAVSRHVEESDVAGAKEVNAILQHEPLHPIWGK
jgi:hypothetical protein